MSRQVSMKVTTLLELLAGNIHPALLKVLGFVLNLWPEATIRLGDLNRSKAENKSAGAKSMIHVVGPPWRALDIGGKYLEQEDLERMEAIINDAFAYDPKRGQRYKVAYAKPHGNGKHVHLQVHDNTVRRGEVSS